MVVDEDKGVESKFSVFNDFTLTLVCSSVAPVDVGEILLFDFVLDPEDSTRFCCCDGFYNALPVLATEVSLKFLQNK